jgi:hypothetical protein
LAVTAEAITLEWEDEPFTSWRAEAGLTLTEGSRTWRESFGSCDAYQLMVEHVSRAIRGDETALLPHPSLSLDTARLIDQIKVSCDTPTNVSVIDSELA